MTPDPTAFSDEWKWFAFPANLDVPALVAQYGALAEDHGEVFLTLLCGWDDSEQTRKRGMALGATAPILPCNDGRLRSAGLPSLALLAAWENGDVDGEILTEKEFKQLAPATEP